MTDTRTDAELRAAYLDGDTDAVGVLFTRHRDRLVVVARQYGYGRVDPEDVVGDVAVTLVARLRSWDPDLCVLSTWLHKITRNATIDRVRRATARGIAEPAFHERLDLVHHEPDPAELHEQRATVRALFAADGAPVDQRAALVQCDLADRSVADAASALGIPSGTVRSRCHRGARAMRELAAVGGWTA